MVRSGPMPISDSDLPPYDIRELLAQPFPERIRLVCRTWASQVYATPIAVVVLYWVKYLLLFAGGWAFFCSFSAGYPGFAAVGSWAFAMLAFQKAILWAIFYESAGFGCSSGPMNGRFWPPLGGFLHFLRPGTTKLPLVPGIPVLGGITRTWLDVALYAANQLFLLRALVAPEVTPALLLPSFVLLPLLAVTSTRRSSWRRAASTTTWRWSASRVASGDALWISACKVRVAAPSGSGPPPPSSTTTSPP